MTYYLIGIAFTGISLILREYAMYYNKKGCYKIQQSKPNYKKVQPSKLTDTLKPKQVDTSSKQQKPKQRKPKQTTIVEKTIITKPHTEKPKVQKDVIDYTYKASRKWIESWHIWRDVYENLYKYGLKYLQKYKYLYILPHFHKRGGESCKPCIICTNIPFSVENIHNLDNIPLNLYNIVLLIHIQF